MNIAGGSASPLPGEVNEKIMYINPNLTGNIIIISPHLCVYYIVFEGRGKVFKKFFGLSILGTHGHTPRNPNFLFL